MNKLEKCDFNNINRITIVTGHYGCGKTNFSVNLALYIKNILKKDVVLCDLDIVNPYFRSADMFETLNKQGIETVAPTYANTNLDIPALTCQIQGLFDRKDKYIVLDVGGDDAGAIALGRYAKKIASEDDYNMFYLVNKFRYFEKEISEENEEQMLLKGIEHVSRLKVDYIVNTSNLSSQTTKENVIDGYNYTKEISKKLGVEVAFNVIPNWLCENDFDQIPNKLFTERFVKAAWE